MSEIKAEFELSRQHSDSAVVKRDSFGSSSSDSPGVARKRRSMPPSTAFAERANAVSALLENMMAKDKVVESPPPAPVRRRSTEVETHPATMTRSADGLIESNVPPSVVAGVDHCENGNVSVFDEMPIEKTSNFVEDGSVTGSVHVVLLKHDEPPPDPPIDYDTKPRRSSEIIVSQGPSHNTERNRKRMSTPNDSNVSERKSKPATDSLCQCKRMSSITKLAPLVINCDFFRRNLNRSNFRNQP